MRIPQHPVAQALLSAFGSGIAAPSANQFTHISPTTAAAVQEELGNNVDLILEGGMCEVGLESTIVDLSKESITVLRPGMITPQALQTVLGVPVLLDTSTVQVPGMHHVHYAPNTQAQLITSTQLQNYLQQEKISKQSVAVLSYSISMKIPDPDNIHIINMPTNAIDYAQQLYQMLRSLDNGRYQEIIIESVPLGAEWDAIRDRLAKATAR